MPIFFAVLRGPSHLLKNRVIIPKPVSVVGSALDADIPFPEIDGLAPLHAKVYLDGKDLMVEALNLNSVSVNNVKDVMHRIKLNTTVCFGDNLELRYEHVPSSKLGNMPMPAMRPSFSTSAAPAVSADHGGNTLAAGGQVIAKAAAAAAAAPKKEPPRKIAEVQLPSGAPIPLEELEGFPIFKGMPTAPCSFKPLGMLASLGHRNGVAEILGWKISGFPAWFASAL